MFPTFCGLFLFPNETRHVTQNMRGAVRNISDLSRLFERSEKSINDEKSCSKPQVQKSFIAAPQRSLNFRDQDYRNLGALGAKLVCPSSSPSKGSVFPSMPSCRDVLKYASIRLGKSQPPSKESVLLPNDHYRPRLSRGGIRAT
jgi:hypothetical protein